MRHTLLISQHIGPHRLLLHEPQCLLRECLLDAFSARFHEAMKLTSRPPCGSREEAFFRWLLSRSGENRGYGIWEPPIFSVTACRPVSQSQSLSVSVRSFRKLVLAFQALSGAYKYTMVAFVARTAAPGSRCTHHGIFIVL